MSDASNSSVQTGPHALATTLRKRIGWICQFIRVCIVIYALSLLGDVFIYSTNFSKTEAEGWRFWLPLASCSGSSLAGAYVTYYSWRLIAVFLDGHSLTADAAYLLRRTALLGIIAWLLNIVSRIMLPFTMTPGKALKVTILLPADFAVLTLLFSLLALAHILETAVETINEQKPLS